MNEDTDKQPMNHPEMPGVLVRDIAEQLPRRTGEKTPTSFSAVLGASQFTNAKNGMVGLLLPQLRTISFQNRTARNLLIMLETAEQRLVLWYYLNANSDLHFSSETSFVAVQLVDLTASTVNVYNPINQVQDLLAAQRANDQYPYSDNGQEAGGFVLVSGNSLNMVVNGSERALNDKTNYAEQFTAAGAGNHTFNASDALAVPGVSGAGYFNDVMVWNPSTTAAITLTVYPVQGTATPFTFVCPAGFNGNLPFECSRIDAAFTAAGQMVSCFQNAAFSGNKAL